MSYDAVGMTSTPEVPDSFVKVYFHLISHLPFANILFDFSAQGDRRSCTFPGCWR